MEVDDLRRIGFIGAPSSAGAHWPGQEKAPEYLRALGLVERLQESGCKVQDWGDLPKVRMQPDPQNRHPQSLQRVMNVTRALSEKVQAVIKAGEIPLVLGGDCSLEIGTVCGFLEAGEDPALLYFDGGWDLRTPIDNPGGILDSMGMAHMLGESDAAPELARIGSRYPLLKDEQVLYFGYNIYEEPETATFERHKTLNYSADQIQGHARQVAQEALAKVEKLAQKFVIHFDVDVMDFTDFPVADVPQHNAGLTFADTMECLKIFVSSPSFAGLTITEFNPDHADEEGKLGKRFIEGVVAALAGNKQ